MWKRVVFTCAFLYNQSVNQSINRSINQSISQSIDQSVNQSISQSVSQSVNQSINQSTLFKCLKCSSQPRGRLIRDNPNKIISNSNKTEWSTIQGVIAQVISKSDMKREVDLKLQA